VGEYVAKFYAPASVRGREFTSDNYAVARELAAWKRKVRGGWQGVQLRAIELPGRHMPFGNKARFVVGVKMEGLGPEDIVVELLLTPAARELATRSPANYQLVNSGQRTDSGEYLYTLDLAPELCGKLEYRIRAFPSHRALSHRFEMGLMRWV
jgi:glycogen phosphorylase